MMTVPVLVLSQVIGDYAIVLLLAHLLTQGGSSRTTMPVLGVSIT
jgi:hypothetical protein